MNKYYTLSVDTDYRISPEAIIMRNITYPSIPNPSVAWLGQPSPDSQKVRSPKNIKLRFYQEWLSGGKKLYWKVSKMKWTHVILCRGTQSTESHTRSEHNEKCTKSQYAKSRCWQTRSIFSRSAKSSFTLSFYHECLVKEVSNQIRIHGKL